LLLVSLVLCLTATDWSRMLATAFLAIFIPSAVFLARVWQTTRHRWVIPVLLLLAALQVHLAFFKYTGLDFAAQAWLAGATVFAFGTGSVLVLWVHVQILRAQRVNFELRKSN